MRLPPPGWPGERGSGKERFLAPFLSSLPNTPGGMDALDCCEYQIAARQRMLQHRNKSNTYVKQHCSVLKEIYQGKPFLGTLLRIQPNSTFQSPVLKSIFPLPLGERTSSSILSRVNLCFLSSTNLIPHLGHLWASTVPGNTFPILGLFIKNVLWLIIQIGIWYFKYSPPWRSLYRVI